MRILSKSLQLLVLIANVLIIAHACATSQITPEALEKVKKGIVTVNTRVAVSPYKNVGIWTGTGFVTDKANGFIITNNHVVGRASIGSYFVTFYNGQQAEAKVIYYDSWQDYAILKIDVAEMPKSAEQINLSKSLAKLNQSVLVVGNTEAQDFSFHTGYISNLYEINGEMPQSSYVISLNSAGGASGSPVLNDQNEAIGVLYGGGKTYIFALHAEYVTHALDSLKKGKIPTRNHIGIISELYSLDKAVKHRQFPKKIMEEYLQKFPDARNRVVAVQSLIAGSTAENLLKPGDIIWEVNGKALGGNLAILDKIMDETASDKIRLAIYRDGQKLEQEISLYDVNKNKVESMINFAGATFFEADDYTSAKSGIPLRSLSIMNVQTGSSFSTIPVSFIQEDKSYYRLVVTIMGGYAISNLNELIKVIPDIVRQKTVNIKFKNYQPYFQQFQSSFQGTLVSSHDELIADIVFDSIENVPRVLKYSNQAQEWISEDIK